MAKYCCFLHPYKSDEDQVLTDTCRECGRPFNFPLAQAPEMIAGYTVVRPLSRGFYSAAYVVEFGNLRKRKVLKIVSKLVYDSFGKDFVRECEEHRRIAEGSAHIIDIEDYRLDVLVPFGDTEIACHVAEMDFVDGITLGEFLGRADRVTAGAVAQLSMDLFAVLDELSSRNTYHNDLHENNLLVEMLPQQRRRAEAEDPLVRLVAIDLNSASDESRSDPELGRLGDIHWAVQHIKALAGRLVAAPDETSDADYRLASVLEEKAYLLSPEASKQRVPTFDECIEDIRRSVRQQRSPWTEALQLRRLNDAYNAQTLAPWFVPYLLVDPEERWVSAISTRGPQVITGMRGCGKTMLLRALQFHARATTPPGETQIAIGERLGRDGYVGLYASCTRLLGSPGTTEIQEPFGRLYVAYAIEALRALRHLRELEPTAVPVSAYRHIGEAVSANLDGAEHIRGATSDLHLEQQLQRVMLQLSKGHAPYSLRISPSAAFTGLAEAVQQSATLWATAHILFLLDDVSTRFLKHEHIAQLMSALLFSSPGCAFKLTTEAQTLELILRSPGQIERARRGRDYDLFDLGAEVNELSKKKRGKEFIEQILHKRAQKCALPAPMKETPRVVLGDVDLEAVARDIGAMARDRGDAASKTDRRRKRVYRGISALARVCVGDIGDIISLYEMILKKANGKGYPVNAETQTECYQDFCSRRLYELNRRSTDLKNFALSFAEASHELLVQSCKAPKVAGRSLRVRQYLKVYVRVTTGDEKQQEHQYQRLRDLIDSGVFVLDGGNPRTKTKDSDPIQQFSLTYRKLFGLSSLIGLSERDRFELSGEALEEWLSKPAEGKRILMRNLAEDADPDAEDEGLITEGEAVHSEDRGPQQLVLLRPEADDTLAVDAESPVDELVEAKTPRIRELDEIEVASLQLESYLCGLGFEERTWRSAIRASDLLPLKQCIAIRYPETGRSHEIIGHLNTRGISIDCVDYEDALQKEVDLPGDDTLIDITGLSKPLIFQNVRNALIRNGRVVVCHTAAAKYYPLDEDITSVLDAATSSDHYALLASLGRILTGETGPYTLVPLLASDADESRRRFLFAFSSPKHERLLTFFDNRDYDRIEIVTQPVNTPRGRVSQIAAEIAARNHLNTEVQVMGSDDVSGIMRLLVSSYYTWFVDRGFNFEIALTGSKTQAVACAAVSASLRVSQCWYVKPQQFDPERFTKGVGGTRFFELSVER